MGFLIRLPRAASYLDENLISTHLWDRLSNAILKALFTSLTQFPIPLDDDDLEIAAYHLYKFMVRLHPGAFLINPEDQEAVANFAQYFAVHVDQYEIYVFTPPSEGIAHRISAVLRGSLMPPPIVMDSYSRYPNADTEGFWARLHQGTWRLVDGFDAEFCVDSPPVGPLGNLEGQDLVVNGAQGFEMLDEGANRRVLDKYVYGTPVAEDSEKAMAAWAMYEAIDEAIEDAERAVAEALRGLENCKGVDGSDGDNMPKREEGEYVTTLDIGLTSASTGHGRLDAHDNDFGPPGQGCFGVPSVSTDLVGNYLLDVLGSGPPLHNHLLNTLLLEREALGDSACQIYTDDQAVSPGNLEGQDPVVLRGSLMPPPIATLFGGTPASDPRGMRPSRQPLGLETRSDGKIISDGRFRENNPSGKKLAAHASNQFAKHRIMPQDYLEALARVF